MDGSQRLTDYLSRDLQVNHDMSLAEYRILVLLSESPSGSLRMSDLADGVLSSRSRLTHQIRRMEAQKMVERSNCVEDGRGVLAHLTAEGRRRLEEAAPRHVESVRRNFIDLADDAQLAALTAVFGQIDATISRAESE